MSDPTARKRISRDGQLTFFLLMGARVVAAVILLRAPLHSGFRALLGPTHPEGFRSFIERLERTYECRFVDFQDRISDSVFQNFEHSNLEGRNHRTGLLAEETLDPIRCEKERAFEQL
jgi:hypothetical protein